MQYHGNAPVMVGQHGGAYPGGAYPGGGQPIMGQPIMGQPIGASDHAWNQVQGEDGKTYYHNTVTNETSWTDPRASTGPAPPTYSQQAPMAAVPVPGSANGADDVPVGTAVQPQAASSALPADWTEVQDPTGQTYYHNTATNETSWQRPS